MTLKKGKLYIKIERGSVNILHPLPIRWLLRKPLFTQHLGIL